MLEGIILGFLSLASMVISFLKLPLHIRAWLLRHKVITDLGAAALCFLLIGSITKSIVGLFASIICGLGVGIGVEIADMADKDPEVRAKLEELKETTLLAAKNRLRNFILGLADGSTNATPGIQSTQPQS